MAVVRNREVATKQGFLMYYSDRGPKVSGLYKQGGRLSGMAVKSGSTV